MKNTTLCYIEQNGAYLLLHRVKRQNDENHDKWIGIGGKFEENESPEDCLLREVPVYELENTPTESAARLSYETMRPDKPQTGEPHEAE